MEPFKEGESEEARDEALWDETQALHERNLYREQDKDHQIALLLEELDRTTRERDDLELRTKVLRDKLIQPPEDFRVSSKESSFLRRPRYFSSRIEELRVAAIMDEFTHSAIAPSCVLEQVKVGGWRKQLEAFRPDVLFVESAWQGNAGQWERQVNHPSQELLDLIEWCRGKDIPTVFWNKEDPVHFETFINTAKLFNYVFTTDLDCIGRYKTFLGHDRVYLMPFFGQPRLHNPLDVYERSPGFCFAGAYYARYADRQRDFDAIIDAAGALAPVEIFDRNHGKGDPKYLFPEKYKSLIRGKLPYDEIARAYKGYEFGINLNSVKQSQTMFARRVFDLMLSNTTVVSNYSRGLRLMFGDLVVSTDSKAQLKKELIPLVKSPSDVVNTRRQRNLLALRKVMLEHTAEVRMAYLLSKLGAVDIFPTRRRVIVTSFISNEQELAAVMCSFKEQAWAEKKLVLVLDGDFVPARIPQAEDLSILTATQARKLRPAEEWADGLIAFFNAKDAYGEHYLTDCVLAFGYSDAEVVGKVAFYARGKDGIGLKNDGAQYRYSESIPVRRAVARTSAMSGSALWDWLDDIDNRTIGGSSCLGIDEFSYVFQGEHRDITFIAPSPLFSGLSIDQLLKLAEGERGQDDSEYTGLTAAELYGLFAKAGSSGAVRLKSDSGALVIHSSLEDGSRKYLHADETLPLSRFAPEEGKVRFHLVAVPGLNLELVMFFLGADGGRLGHVSRYFGRNHVCVVPAGTEQVRLGLRIAGPGLTKVHALATQAVGGAKTLPAQASRHGSLVLTNVYPSSEALYRNGFVHRRVIGYREAGVNAEVFALNSKRLSGPAAYEFENVDVLNGDASVLESVLAHGNHKNVLVHFLDPDMWGVLKRVLPQKRIFVWVHGAEVQPWYRREFNYSSDEEREAAKAESKRRIAFWREVLELRHPNLRFIFVSRYFADEVFHDVGVNLPSWQFYIIHNFIDTELFDFKPKPASQRFKVLSIRPFASKKYANDLSVKAIIELSSMPGFNDIEFRIIGDGARMEKEVEPLRSFPNVIIERGFLAQREIAEIHKNYGVFLCPTRMDSQGVSRDEAMSSGLVPVTNAVTAIPEFVDETCGVLAPREGYREMAAGIRALIDNPEMFCAMSKAAALRVRAQSGFSRTIEAEVALIC